MAKPVKPKLLSNVTDEKVQWRCKCKTVCETTFDRLPGFLFDVVCPKCQARFFVIPEKTGGTIEEELDDDIPILVGPTKVVKK